MRILGNVKPFWKITFCLLTLAVSISWLLLSSSDLNKCANAIIDIASSPDGKWDAVLFERNCGATTGYSSQVSLINSNYDLRNEGGNIYIAEGYPEEYSLNWIDSTSLQITGVAGRIFKSEAEYLGIKINYK